MIKSIADSWTFMSLCWVFLRAEFAFVSNLHWKSIIIYGNFEAECIGLAEYVSIKLVRYAMLLCSRHSEISMLFSCATLE